jgi:hypothetical protein
MYASSKKLMKKNFALKLKFLKLFAMKNQKLKNALKQLNTQNELTNKKGMEFLDSKKSSQIRGGTGVPKGSTSSDSCGNVFSCGLYHVV